MNLMCELSDEDVGLRGGAARYDRPYRLRKAARAVLFNADGLVSFQYIARDGYYKLPGGGLDAGESILDGLRREIREEVGCALEVTGNIGIVIEYRNGMDLLQMSYCFMGRAVGNVRAIQVEQDEIDEGLTPLWAPFDEVFARVRESQLTIEKAHFIVRRDLAILEAARTLIQ